MTSARSLTLIFLLLNCLIPAKARLIAWFKFDEGSGVNVADSTGRGNDLGFEGSGHSWTLKIGAPFPNSGGALHFNGSGGAVAQDSPFAPNLNPQTINWIRNRSGGAATVAFWTNTTVANGQQATSPFFLTNLNDSNAWQRILQAHVLWSEGNAYFDADNDGTEAFAAPATAGYSRLSIASTLPANTWVHWAFVLDSSAGAGAMKIYRNGTQIASGPSLFTGSLGWQHVDRFEIGGGNKSSWSGALDDFALWDEALTASQIASVHTQGVASVFRPSIEAFSASPGNIGVAGSPVVFQWALAEGSLTSLTLNPGNINLLPLTTNQVGVHTLNPLATGTYTLTATGPGGTSSSSVVVGVGLAETDFRLNELMADNQATLFDEDGEASDWIEIHNPNAFSKSLAGWKLSEGASTWTFPAVNIPSGGHLVVFASGQDRADPARQLHTNFKLPREGGILSLIRPDATVSASLLYPAQNSSASYGLAAAQVTASSLIEDLASARPGIMRYLPATAPVPADWNTVGFDASSWTSASFTSIGFDQDFSGATSFVPHFRQDLGSASASATAIPATNPMFGKTSTLYTRYAFDVPSKAAVNALTLKLKFEDAFVAYLNGVEVARGNFTGTPAFDSTTTARTELDAVKYTSYDISTLGLAALQDGPNVLAIFVLNASKASNDFLLAPLLETSAFQLTNLHLVPTPGSANGATATPGPLVASVTHGLVDTLGQPRQPVRPGLTSGTVAADSIDHFSTTQGQNGWTYGSFAGLVTSYTGTFTQIGTTFDYGTYGVGYGAASPPYTRITAEMSHPNGSASTGGTQSTVRRWTSTFAGPAVLEGFFHHIANAGDGTRWQIFKNGAALLPAPVTVRTSLHRFTLNTSLAIGDRLDLVGDAGAGSLDASDGSRSWLRVWRNPVAENPALHDLTLPVSAVLLPTVSSIASANLFYAIDFGTEVSLPMTAGASNVWTASIPLASLRGGQLLRWRVSASDSSATTTTHPAYLDTLDSPRYEGTVALDPDLPAQTRLNVFHLFVADPAAAITATGTRASLFWKGTLYDNVSIDLHAASSAGYAKKSFDIDFNQGHRFRFVPGGIGHTDINLITNWRDRSKVRNPLAYQMFGLAGHPTLHAETVRLQLNGVFYSTIDLIGEANDGVLEEAGLNKEGAFYKIQNNLDRAVDATAAIEKKNRKFEGNNEVLELINGTMTDLPANAFPENTAESAAAAATVHAFSQNRHNWLCENVNLPGTVNFIAAMTVSTSSDWGHKNYFIYRDNGRSNQWMPIPWDLDLAWGHYWNGSYFDDTIRIMPNDFHSAVFSGYWGSNPFFRTYYYTQTGTTHGNTYSQMRLRRTRTLVDQLFAATASPNLEARIDALAATINPPDIADNDAAKDLKIWGWWNQHLASPAVKTMAEEVARLKATYLPLQRAHFANNPAPAYGNLPAAQAANPAVRFGTYDSNPAGNDQGREYIEIVNDSAAYVDLTGWKLAGGVDFIFPAGAVISPAGNSLFNGRLYIPKTISGWRARTVSPKTSEGRLVLFTYDGQLSNRGDTVQLLNPAGAVVSTLTVPANPSALQNFLRITEINYNPALADPPENAALPGVLAQDFEFVELTNTALTPLDISGCYFEDGITFTVPAGVVIPAGGSVIIAKRPQAFAVRYPSVALFNNILGPYEGNLSNGGERLTLREPNGETILSFTYSDTWFKPALGNDPTDGGGRTLVIADPKADYTAWDDSGSWRPSAALGGSPDTTPANDAAWNYEVWRRTWFTSLERLDENISGAAVTPADGVSQALRYALGLGRTSLDRAKLPAAQLVTVGPDTFLALSHRRLKNELDLTYTVETTTDFVTWTPVPGPVGSPTDNGDGTETVTHRVATPATPGTTAQHIRLRVLIAP